MRKLFFSLLGCAIAASAISCTSPKKKAEISFNICNIEKKLKSRVLEYSEIDLSDEEKAEAVCKIIDGSKQDLSFDDFCASLDELCRKQKLYALGWMGDSMGWLLYRLSGADRDEMFDAMKQSYREGEAVPTGQCGSIHNLLANIAERIGFDSGCMAVDCEGGGHIITAILDGSEYVLVDYGSIYKTKTCNLEKALNFYQREQGVAGFQHSFFRPDKHGSFYFEFETGLGKALLNMTGITNPEREMRIRNEESIELRISDIERSLRFQRKDLWFTFGSLSSYEHSLRDSSLFLIGCEMREDGIKVRTVGGAGILGKTDNGYEGVLFGGFKGRLFQEKQLDSSSLRYGVACSSFVDFSPFFGRGFRKTPMLEFLRFGPFFGYKHGKLFEARLSSRLEIVLNDCTEQDIVARFERVSFDLLFGNPNKSFRMSSYAAQHESRIAFGFEMRAKKASFGIEGYHSSSRDTFYWPHRLGFSSRFAYEFMRGCFLTVDGSYERQRWKGGRDYDCKLGIGFILQF